MSESNSGFDISGLPNDLSERFAMQGYPDGVHSHEQLHFYDSTGLQLGLCSDELLNPADSNFMDRYSSSNLV
jgi:hypothetical protein